MQTSTLRWSVLSKFVHARRRALVTARTSYKAAQVASLICQFFAEALVIRARVSQPVERQKFFLENASKYAALALKAMGITVEIKGADQLESRTKNQLLVGNHMSYIDAMVMASVLPCAFVTSVDMGEQVFLGDMARLGGSIFVERRSRERVEQDLSSMAEALASGIDVMIYPEGTSTNGENVLPFKKSLLMSAVSGGVHLQPVVIRYLEVDGKKFGPANRDNVCWYGKMDFVSHLWRVLSLRRGIKAELEFLEEIPVSAESTRQELAEQTYRAVSEAYIGRI